MSIQVQLRMPTTQQYRYVFHSIYNVILFVVTHLHLLPQNAFRSPQNTPHSRLCLDEEHGCH